MAEREVAVKYKVTAEGKGFDRLGREADKAVDKLDPKRMSREFNKLSKSVEKVEKSLRSFATHTSLIDRMIDRFERLASAAERFAGATGGGGGGGRGGGGGGGSGGGGGGARQGTFGLGLAQGVGMGEFLVPGPGMRQQIAGRMLGGAARGLASSPFTGVAGLTQGIGALPGGGIAAGQINAGVAAAAQYIQFEQSLQALAPALRFGRAARAGREGDSTAGALAAQQAAFQGAAGGHMDATTPVATAARRIQQAQGLRRGAKFGGEPLAGTVMQMENQARQIAATPETEAQRRARELEAVKLGFQASDQTARGQRARARRKALGLDALGVGQQFGLDISQTAQAGGRLARAAGQGLDRKALEMALGAQAGFGVDLGSSGAFLRGGAEGQFGGQRNGTEMLRKTMEEAMAAGIDKADVASFIQQQAGDIASFASTGLPVAPESMLDLAKTMQGMAGSGGMLSMQQARGFRQKAGALSKSGEIGSSLDFLLMQSAGFQGGGAGDYLSALEALERPTGGMLRDVLGGVNKSFGGSSSPQAMLALRKASQRLGIGGDKDQLHRIQRVLEGRGTPEDNALFDDLAARRAAGADEAAGGVLGAGRRATGGAQARGAGQRSRRIREGGKVVGSVQDLEEAQINALKSFTTFKDQAKALSEGVLSVSRMLPGLAEAIKSALDTLNSKAVPEKGEHP